jgi:uncharacterized membrane protein YgcG/gas vesicle protein
MMIVRRKKGFTLAEILVATLILMLCLAIVGGLVWRGMIAYNRGQTAAQLQHTCRTAVDRVSSDLKQAYLGTVNTSTAGRVQFIVKDPQTNTDATIEYFLSGKNLYRQVNSGNPTVAATDITAVSAVQQDTTGKLWNVSVTATLPKPGTTSNQVLTLAENAELRSSETDSVVFSKDLGLVPVSSSSGGSSSSGSSGGSSSGGWSSSGGSSSGGHSSSSGGNTSSSGGTTSSSGGTTSSSGGTTSSSGGTTSSSGGTTSSGGYTSSSGGPTSPPIHYVTPGPTPAFTPFPTPYIPYPTDQPTSPPTSEPYINREDKTDGSGLNPTNFDWYRHALSLAGRTTAVADTTTVINLAALSGLPMNNISPQLSVLPQAPSSYNLIRALTSPTGVAVAGGLSTISGGLLISHGVGEIQTGWSRGEQYYGNGLLDASTLNGLSDISRGAGSIASGASRILPLISQSSGVVQVAGTLGTASTVLGGIGGAISFLSGGFQVYQAASGDAERIAALEGRDTTYATQDAYISGGLGMVSGALGVAAAACALTGVGAPVGAALLAASLIVGGVQLAFNAVGGSAGVIRIGNAIGSAVSSAATWVRNGVSSVASTVANAASNAISAVRNTVSNVANTVRNTVTNVASAVRNTVSNVANTVRNTVTNVASAVRNTVSNVASSVRNTVSNVASAVRNTVSNVANTVRNTVSNVANTVRNTVSNVASTVRNTVSSVSRSVSNAVSNVSRSVSNAVSNVASSVRNTVSNVASSVSRTVSSVSSSVRNTVSNVTSTVRNTVSNVASSVSRAASNVASSVGNFFRGW